MARNVLTYAQKQTIEEVVSQYGLRPAQQKQVLDLVNEQAWTVASMAYFKPYDAAHTACAKLTRTR